KSSAVFSPCNHFIVSKSLSLSVATVIVTGPSVGSVGVCVSSIVIGLTGSTILSTTIVWTASTPAAFFAYTVYVPFALTSKDSSSRLISFPSSAKSAISFLPSNHLTDSSSSSLSVVTETVIGPSGGSVVDGVNSIVIGAGGTTIFSIEIVWTASTPTLFFAYTVYVPFSSTLNPISSRLISIPPSTKSAADFSPFNHLTATSSSSLSVATETVTGPSVSSVVEGVNETVNSFGSSASFTGSFISASAAFATLSSTDSTNVFSPPCNSLKGISNEPSSSMVIGPLPTTLPSLFVSSYEIVR